MKKIPLMIERFSGKFYGTIEIQQTKIVVHDRTVEGLEGKMKIELRRLFQLRSDDVHLQRCYNLTALFSQFQFIKPSVLAKLCGISVERLQVYEEGVAYPTGDEEQRIQAVLHALGQELLEAFVCTPEPVM